ncbi:GspH/FimT family pseudopilin [Pseudoxanthomonas sp. 10H]|uniref:GspH/FimT family pseudopilin n=1 Tax=Pseudoxanthomonas sp. 10H TaxID=3242729 RepID=UPI003557C58A
MRKDAPGPETGFTLLELSLCLAVASVLAVLAVPELQRMTQRYRAGAAMHLLATDLALARNAAVSRGVPVTLCPSRGDGRCRDTPDWSAGWLVYRDPQRAAQPASAGDILQDVRQPLHASVRVAASAGRLRVRYQPQGFSPGSNLTLRVCAAMRLQGEVVVNNAGRPRSRRVDGRVDCPF